MASVFLSYDHDDASLAQPIVQVLEKAGHTVWFDRHIHGGAQYSRKIEQALEEADAVVVLWSPRSLESAWVRDEAAEGRDRGKLVPISVEGVTPPIGFRQFQTIGLGAWKGRGKVPKSDELLNAVASQAGVSRQGASTSTATASPPHSGSGPGWQVAVAVLSLLVVIAAGAWAWIGRTGMPIVQIAAANSSPGSQAIASDLFVKLGSLAEIGKGKWQLVDSAAGAKGPTYLFRAADTGSAGNPQANLTFLDGKEESLLWSGEFSVPRGGEADLRQRMAFTAGRVLACALETRDAGGLPRAQFKLFLNSCAQLAEASMEEPEKVARPLRVILAERPKFVPAWARLITADLGALDLMANTAGADEKAASQLRADMERARKVEPELPELALAEAKLLAPTEHGRILDLLESALEKAPDNVTVLSEQITALSRVGRMAEAIAAARKAAELDPLSPGVTTQLIMSLAYGGQVEQARQELARAERLWAGTGALRDALYAFHLRYGDPVVAMKYNLSPNLGLRAEQAVSLYLNARADPSRESTQKLLAHIARFEGRPEATRYTAWVVQALSEFGAVDAAFGWLGRTPADQIADSSYLLFRPGTEPLRKDQRFMAVAKRLGLTKYWQTSGKWPDFCSDVQWPYDCKSEAAKSA